MNNRAMKDSGVEWMEEIPSHWEVSKVKNLATEKNTVFLDGDWIESEFITNSGVRLIQTGNIGVGFYKEQGFRYITEETFEILNCRYIEAGDLLISRLAGPVGRSCLAPKLEEKMICSVDICSLRPNENIDPKFLNFHFTAKGHLEYCSLIARGATLQRISRKQLGNVAVVIPPLHEQQAIAAYLNEKISNLDRLIQDQKRVIEEWKAYKQSLITETVTKGLNPEAELKDSGIEWIGEIPSHWEVRKVKYLFRIVGGNGFPEHLQGEVDGDIPFLKVSDINGLNDYVDTGNNYVSISTVKQYRWNVIQENSILMPKIGESLKKNHRKLNRIPCLIDNNTQALVANNLLNHKYFFYQLKCVNMIWFDNSSTIPCVNNKKFRNSSLSYPPLHEQQQIADFLDEKCSKIDRLIENKQCLIEELKAYKQSLIYECVTGKKEIV